MLQLQNQRGYGINVKPARTSNADGRGKQEKMRICMGLAFTNYNNNHKLVWMVSIGIANTKSKSND